MGGDGAGPGHRRSTWRSGAHWSWQPNSSFAPSAKGTGTLGACWTPRGLYEPARTFDERIQQKPQKIGWRHDPDLDARLVLAQGFGASVTIELEDGRRLARGAEKHRGGPGTPSSRRRSSMSPSVIPWRRNAARRLSPLSTGAVDAGYERVGRVALELRQ